MLQEGNKVFFYCLVDTLQDCETRDSSYPQKQYTEVISCQAVKMISTYCIKLLMYRK